MCIRDSSMTSHSPQPVGSTALKNQVGHQLGQLLEELSNATDVGKLASLRTQYTLAGCIGAH
eukprot:13497771-Alexandrium_andersonii.AAC.1